MQTELPITLTLPLTSVNAVINSLQELAMKAQAVMQDVQLQTQPQVNAAREAMLKKAEAAAAETPPAAAEAPPAPPEDPLAGVLTPTEQPPHDPTPIAAAAAQAVDTPPEPQA